MKDNNNYYTKFAKENKTFLTIALLHLFGWVCVHYLGLDAKNVDRTVLTLVLIYVAENIDELRKKGQ